MNRPLSRRLRLAPLAALVLLAGCGQKGPLYLPERTPGQHPQATAPGPVAPAEKTRDNTLHNGETQTQPEPGLPQ